MKPLIFFTGLLSAILLCSSCAKKDKEVQPSVDVTGAWQLSAVMPFPDTTWQPLADTDSASYIFSADGKFAFTSKAYQITGTYKVLPDGGRIKLIATGRDSLSQYLQIEKLGPGSIKVDDWLKGFARGYSSRKFVRMEMNE